MNKKFKGGGKMKQIQEEAILQMKREQTNAIMNKLADSNNRMCDLLETILRGLK